MLKTKLTTSILIAILGLSACSEQKTPEQYLTLSQQLIEEDKIGEAIVELKNAIKNNLSNPELRLALAKGYLLQGNFLSAEKEYDKSISLGVPLNDVIVEYSFVKSKLGKSQEVFELVDQGSELSDDSYIELLLNAGVSALNDSQIERGQDYLSQAISLSKDEDTIGLMARGYLDYSQRKYEQGLTYTEQLLKNNALASEAWLLRGHLLFANKEFHLASESFREYQKIMPLDLNVRLFEINALIQSEQFVPAEKRLALILESFKDNFAVNQYKSQIEYYKKSYTEAKIFADKALALNSTALVPRVISGMSSFKLNNYEQAYTRLSPAMKSIPSDSAIQQIYAFLKLQLGYSNEISDTSVEAPNIDEIKADLFLSKGIGLIQQGDIAKVQNIIEQRGTSIDNNLERAELGLLKVIVGNESGIEDLESAVEREPTSDRLKVALSAAYLSSNRADEALKVALDWQSDDSKNLNANLLVAKIYLQIRQPEQAVEYLNNVLAIDPSNIFASMFFAEKAIGEKNYEEAQDIANQIIQNHPNYTSALGVLYKATRSNPEETIEKIKKVVEDYPNDLNNAILYASILYREKRYEEVILVLNDKTNKSKSSLNEYWLLLGESYIKLGQYAKALLVTEEWVSNKPNMLSAWYAKLNVLEALGNKSELLVTTQSFLKMFPNDTRFRMLLPYYQIVNGNYYEAEQVINKLLPEEKATDYISGLRGRILFAKKEYVNAIPLLEVNYDLKPSPQNAGLLYSAYIKASKLESALIFMEEHLKQNPQDKLTKFFYAQYLMEKNPDKSKKIYYELLKDDLQNVVVLNNLASLELKAMNYVVADELATKALSLRKDSPEILDTLAMIKLAQGNTKEALSLLERALELAPDNEDIRKHKALAGTK